MSNQFLKLRRSSVPGRVPTTASLDFGEIALNTYDGLAFIKKSSSNGEEIIAIGATATVSGSQYFIPVFSGSGVTESTIFQSGSFIGFPNATEPIDPNNPDLLYISGAGVDTYNLISAHSYKNGYIQLNIQNFSPGNLASSDIVATANNGDESNYYIDMGINSEGYSNSNLIGSANDAYVYSTGNDLYIGNASANKRLILFNGGFDTLNYAKVFVHDQGTVGINSSTYNAANPPSLFVNSRDSVTTNVIQAKADADDFTEVSHANLNAGTAASADFVAYNDIDPEGQSSGYVDMGINSTNYVYNGIYPGTAGDAYVYTDSHHLILGTISQSVESKVTIFAGGVSENDNAKLVLYGSNQHVMTGSLNASQGFTGSLFGTASWALNSRTASYVGNAVSASYAATASYAPLYLPLTGGVINGNVTVNGTASIAFLNVTYESSSIIVSTGSNVFGDAANDTQTLYGSVIIPTGSLTVTGSVTISGSLFATSSWAINALTASYVPSAAIVGDLSRIATGSVTASVGTANDIFRVVSGSLTYLHVSGNVNIYGNTSNQATFSTTHLFYGLGRSQGGRFKIAASPTTVITDSPALAFVSASGEELGYIYGDNNRIIVGARQPSTTVTNTAYFYAAANRAATQFGLTTNTADLTDNTVAVFRGHWTGGSALELKPFSVSSTSNTFRVRNINDNGNDFTVNFTGNTLIGSSTDTGYKLLVSGSGASGSLNVDNILTVSSSVVTMTGSLNVSGSALFYNSGSTGNLVKIYSDTNAYGGIEFGSLPSPTAELKAAESAGTVQLISKRGGTSSNIQLHTGAVERLRVTSTGTIIGSPFTYTPAYMLDVNGSGSFRQGLSVSGSFVVTGSASITGSLNAPSITGSLFGTASWALNALTASSVSSTAIVGDLSRIATGSVTASVDVGAGTFQLVSGPSTFLYVNNSGSVGIGSTALTNTNLRVSRTITGSATPSSIYTNTTVQADAVSFDYYLTDASTVNTSFALSNLYHYRARQGTFSNVSAGGSVFGQFGYFVDSTLVGASNNYAYYSQIPFGSGRWNLYMQGGASNYLSGSLLIGTTTVASFKLDVSGSIRTSDQLYIESASIDYQQNLSVATGSWQTIVASPTGSYKAAFFDYVAFSGSIGRAGTVTTFWSASATEFYENFTEDLGGNTSGVVLQTAISASQIVLQATASSAAWTIRSLVRLL